MMKRTTASALLLTKQLQIYTKLVSTKTKSIEAIEPGKKNKKQTNKQTNKKQKTKQTNKTKNNIVLPGLGCGEYNYIMK